MTSLLRPSISRANEPLYRRTLVALACLGLAGVELGCDDATTTPRTGTSGGSEGSAGTGEGEQAGSNASIAGQTGQPTGQAGQGGNNQPVAVRDAGTRDLGAFDCSPSEASSIPDLQLTEIASEFSEPIYLASPPGDDPRLFVVEKGGTIRVIENGQVVSEPFLDISDVVEEPFNEMGLLGFALHPDFASNGRVFVYYSTEADPNGGFLPAHTSLVAEYTVSSDNPNQAALDSAREILRIAQPEGNHNGGNLQFGPDGFLYIPTGDGGGGGDYHGDIGNGQDLDTLLAKMLRIDVNAREGGREYAIAPGNMSAPARPEIWSYGWRNPWRFSFDACTGDMYVGDVGEDSFEEVDFEPAGVESGRNYGWRLMEADACFEPNAGCDATAQNLQPPIASYNRDIGQSITGGYVYRGSAIPDLRGVYLYADFASSVIFALRVENGTVVGEPEDITANLNTVGTSAIASFAQDNRGNLYVVSFGGAIFRIDPG